MPEEDATPPALARVEQVGEKIGAVAIVVGVLFGISYMLNESRPLDFAYMGERFPILLDAVQVSLFFTVMAYLCGMAIGFFMGWLGTVTSREKSSEDRYPELEVRSLTGAGAEGAVQH